MGARTKILLADVVALEMELELNRRIDPGTSQTDTSIRGAAVLELNVRATHHLNIFADINPHTLTDLDSRRQWFAGYTQTYLERDLRDLSVVASLVDFRRLMRAACLRLGNLANQTEQHPPSLPS